MVGEEAERLLRGLRGAGPTGGGGATGTGKTTWEQRPPRASPPRRERLVCIEEASELRPNHPHVVHLQARSANAQWPGR